MPLKPPDDCQVDGQVPAATTPRRRPRFVLIGTADLTGIPMTCRLRLVPAPRHLHGLTAAWIAQSGTGAVVLDLFSARPDVWQVAAHLTRLGYRGRVFALSPALPNRAMVEGELRADFPGLRIRVLPVLRAQT